MAKALLTKKKIQSKNKETKSAIRPDPYAALFEENVMAQIV